MKQKVKRIAKWVKEEFVFIASVIASMILVPIGLSYLLDRRGYKARVNDETRRETNRVIGEMTGRQNEIEEALRYDWLRENQAKEIDEKLKQITKEREGIRSTVNMTDEEALELFRRIRKGKR